MATSSSNTPDVSPIKTAEWATPVAKPAGVMKKDSPKPVSPCQNMSKRVNESAELAPASMVGALYLPVL